MKTDRASMAHSLEARVPFLDSVVTGLRARAADAAQGARPAKKRLLRKAAEPLLPARIVHGRKRGFSIPAAAWLRGELEPFARDTLVGGRRCGGRASSARAGATRLLDEHVAGKQDWSRQLWGLLAFTLWYERHVEQREPAVRSR